MPRDKYSRSPSRSKKSKKRSKSRDRDRDYDRKYKKSSKSSRSRDSPDNRRKRDRYRRRSSSRSDSSDSRSPSYSSSRSSSRYKTSSRHEKSNARSRSQSTGPPTVCPPPPVISERYNFQDAVNILDATGSNNRENVAEIDKNEFVPQSFTSTSTKKLPDKVKIDLDMGTIELPPMPNQEEEEETLINPKFFGDEKERMTRWIRKLLYYRQPRMDTS